MAMAAVRTPLLLNCAVSSCLTSVHSSAASAESCSCSTFLPLPLRASSRGSGFSHSVSSTQRLSGRGFGTIRRSSKGRNGTVAGAGGSVVCRASSTGGGALTPELKQALDQFIGSHKVVLFMKGNRNFPQCGFSNTCVQILNQCQAPYETVNILEDESLRQGVKEYSSWPTYPQLYIDGEFYGGCDIALEAFKSGELKEAIDKALLS